MITGATGRVVLVVLGLLLVLTYLLLRVSTPDAVLYDQRLRAIDAMVLNQAALHRDVLRASHGLLLNYDPLVATTRRLREFAEELRGRRARSSTALPRAWPSRKGYSKISRLPMHYCGTRRLTLHI